jgi:anti-sigma B factor antagonist
MSAASGGAAPDKRWPSSANDPIITSVADRDGITVVTVGGEIDMFIAPTLEAAIAEGFAADAKALIIDLSAVEFIASAGLQILAATHEKISKSAHFAVVATYPATTRPIQLTGLDEILDVYPTLDDALTAVRMRLVQ